MSEPSTSNTQGAAAEYPLAKSYAYCCKLARRTGSNFYFSFLTLPRDQFRAMCVLYAFMRISDDIGDDAETSLEARAGALAAWKASVIQALAGVAFDHPALPALREITETYTIPHEHFLNAIDGIAMDLDSVRFRTFEDLKKYCYHVAGVVGLCCIEIWGYHDQRARDAAVDCGLAFQLTNILRDLNEDAAMGRIYLPDEDLQRFDYRPEDLIAECRDERFRELMRFEVARARGYYEKSLPLFEYLDPAGRPALEVMHRIYRGLLDRIEQSGYDVFSKRIRLTSLQKLRITGTVLLKHQWGRLKSFTSG